MSCLNYFLSLPRLLCLFQPGNDPENILTHIVQSTLAWSPVIPFQLKPLASFAQYFLYRMHSFWMVSWPLLRQSADWEMIHKICRLTSRHSISNIDPQTHGQMYTLYGTMQLWCCHVQGCPVWFMRAKVLCRVLPPTLCLRLNSHSSEPCLNTSKLFCNSKEIPGVHLFKAL